MGKGMGWPQNWSVRANAVSYLHADLHFAYTCPLGVVDKHFRGKDSVYMGFG